MERPELVKNDPYLSNYEPDFIRWREKFKAKQYELVQGKPLTDFATGYLYFGLFRNQQGWVIRDWAPNANAMFLIGDFNNWQEVKEFELKNIGNGCWELQLDSKEIKHGDLYAFSMHWQGGSGKRIPAWANRVVQDPDTLIFTTQVWDPPVKFKWKNPDFKRGPEAPIIYEAHIGMAGEEPRVHTYVEFRKNILPRVKKGGYNIIQLMAIPEHPYYGSFGYHVSSFFAASSRFGTPEELKQLIDEAHGMGISVIMDLVQSHAVRNEVEGLGNYDGTRYQFFHEGPRGEHPAWDSYCFNYNKNEVIHFLLSNIKYWMEEYRFDGFRFDGVTSMLYLDHGLGKAFTSYADYFSPNLDDEAVVYLMLANKLMHTINPHAIAIAEDMSGLPGLASPQEIGGIGFDYRLAMGVPDYWIKVIKEMSDEDWNVGLIFHELTSHRADEKVVSYAEGHDQALVGDKTIIFRLLDKEMYYSMRKDQPNLAVDRGIALHKMIRLATITCAGGGYMNFMGNEFGHPEWIDFPREGNGWSYNHARRIWSISEDPELRYCWLLDFDRDMINFVREEKLLEDPWIQWISDNPSDQVLAYRRKDFVFIFNFNPSKSFEGYGFRMEPSKFRVVLNSDAHAYGGFNRIDDRLTYYTIPEGGFGSNHYLKIYLPARTAVVLKNSPAKAFDNIWKIILMMQRIFTIGETTYDIQFRDGKPVNGCGGGSAFNSAISLGRCGLPVSLISTFGSDKIGDISLKMLTDNGVNCSFIKRFEGQSRVALAFIGKDHNPQYSFYAASMVVIPDYPKPQKDDLILLGSTFALRDEGRDELLLFLRNAGSKGCIIIYDPNARQHISNDPTAKAKILENISLATIVKGSDEDFRNIFHETEGVSAYQKIRMAGSEYLFYTKGAEGAELFTPEFHLEIKAPELKVVSTIGAGDNFSAGLVYGILANQRNCLDYKDLKIEDWRKIMEFGTLFAGDVCQSSENYISWETAKSLNLKVD